MNTCRSVGARLESLSQRIARATQLLSTRVDVSRERQNQQVLESMNRRAEAQLRLQQTVEGLSAAAIYLLRRRPSWLCGKGLAAAGWPLNPELAIALSIPVVAFVALFGVRTHARSMSRAVRWKCRLVSEAANQPAGTSTDRRSPTDRSPRLRSRATPADAPLRQASNASVQPPTNSPPTNSCGWSSRWCAPPARCVCARRDRRSGTRPSPRSIERYGMRRRANIRRSDSRIRTTRARTARRAAGHRRPSRRRMRSTPHRRDPRRLRRRSRQRRGHRRVEPTAGRRARDLEFLVGHVGRDIREQRRAEVALTRVRQHAQHVGARRQLAADLQRPRQRRARRRCRPGCPRRWRGVARAGAPRCH